MYSRFLTSMVCSYEWANGKYDINVSNSVKTGFWMKNSNAYFGVIWEKNKLTKKSVADWIKQTIFLFVNIAPLGKPVVPLV